MHFIKKVAYIKYHRGCDDLLSEGTHRQTIVHSPLSLAVRSAHGAIDVEEDIEDEE